MPTRETTYDATVSDSLVDSALLSYLFSDDSTPHEKQAIRRHRHAEKHGSVAVESTDTGNTIQLSLSIEGETHTSEFSKRIETYEGEVAGHSATFGNLRLVAIGLKDDYPWADEAFEAIYWVDNVIASEPDDWGSEEEWVLIKYKAPRPLPDRDTPPSPLIIGVDQFTHAKGPNPWEYASLSVPYEDTTLAQDLLERSRHWDGVFNLRTTEDCI